MVIEVQVIQALLAATAIGVTVLAVLYSVGASRQISSSDHHAAEQVKSYTARLFASLTSMTEKWALNTAAGGDKYDITEEQKVLTDFVNSESAMAFRAWIGDSGATLNEKWNIFFLILERSSTGRSSEIDINNIVDALLLLESLETKDVKRITRYNSKLVRLVTTGLTDHNVIVQGAIGGLDRTNDSPRARGRHGGGSDERATEQLRWLKKNGISDPDVDMFLGVLTDDVDLVRRAMAEGADLGVPLSSVIDRYRDKLRQAGYTFTQARD